MIAITAALSVTMAVAVPLETSERAAAVVTMQPYPELTRAVADELEAAGYSVRVSDDAASVEPRALAASEPCASAWACVAIVEHGTGWEVRILTQGRGADHARPRLVFTDGGRGNPQTLGLQIADVLHAAQTAPPPAPAAASESSPASPPTARFFVGADAMVLGSPGTPQPTLGPSVGISHYPREQIGLDIAVHSTALELRRREPEGVARLGMSWAWFSVAFRRVWPKVAIGARAGGGPMLAWARGRAAAGFSDRTRVKAGAVAGASPFVDVRLSRAVYLRTSAWLLFTIPTLNLSVTSRRIATIGLPLLGGSVGLAWGRA